jgi:glycerol-3-phosphate dehydrogenase (NAD(P)+)
MSAAPAIGIVGAGAWGTALAINFAAAGLPIALWGRTVDDLRLTRENRARLPGVPFPESLTVVTHFEALAACSTLLLAVPAQTIRATCRDLAPHIESGTILVICAKGIERDTGKPLAEVVSQEAPHAIPCVLSGPTFAAEVARGLPTAATVAAAREDVAASLAERLSNRSFRLYHSTDLIGVEIAGALKNVVAIACGIVSGSGLGENARAALMTRGLAEISRLALRLGARQETMMGLAGFGDLALTSSSLQSRNFSFGYHIGEGRDIAAAAGGMLAEGAATAGAVLTLAGAHDIEMPIAEAVHAILSGTLTIEDAVASLMQRKLKREI